MRLYHWMLIVILLLVFGYILNWPLLYVLGGLIFARTLYAAIEKNRIKTYSPINKRQE